MAAKIVRTLQECQLDAIKYETRTEWAKKSGTLYKAARENGWLDQCCGHMTPGYLKYVKHTLESCITEAAKHKTKRDWEKAAPASYRKAHSKKWLPFCLSLRQKSMPTFEQCKASAVGFRSRTAWAEACSKEYNFAKRQEWLDLIFPEKQKGGRPRKEKQ
jgi:hypothetical protein